MALAGIGLILLLYRLRLRQITARADLQYAERLEERTRIARELHDTLLQSFQASLLFMQSARNLFSRRSDQAEKTLDDAITTAAAAIAEARNAVGNLRSSTAMHNDLAETLKALGDGTGCRPRRDVSTHCGGFAAGLAPGDSRRTLPNRRRSAAKRIQTCPRAAHRGERAVLRSGEYGCRFATTGAGIPPRGPTKAAVPGTLRVVRECARARRKNRRKIGHSERGRDGNRNWVKHPGSACLRLHRRRHAPLGACSSENGNDSEGHAQE